MKTTEHNAAGIMAAIEAAYRSQNAADFRDTCREYVPHVSGSKAAMRETTLIAVNWAAILDHAAKN